MASSSIEVERLREIEAAARDLALYDDFGEPVGHCPFCDPLQPDEMNAARRRLHAALSTR